MYKKVMRIQLSFEIEHLWSPRNTFFFSGVGNPYVLVKDNETSQHIGITETVWKAIDSSFCTPIYIEFPSRSESPYVTICVYDNYGNQNEERHVENAGSKSGDSLVGEYLLDLSEFKSDIDNGGFGFKKVVLDKSEKVWNARENSDSKQPTLTVCGHQSSRTDERILLQFRGLGIKNVEKGVFSLTRTDPFFVIKKKHTYAAEGRTCWQTIYQSKYFKNHLNPVWERFTLNLEQLCDGDFSKDLQIEVWDFESAKNKFVGKLRNDINLEILMTKLSIKGNADRKNALRLVEEDDGFDTDTAGEIIVLKAEMV
mmetsp:Transcript_2374/g.2847  ORF Transcript_2374/g.2847 Transcript_2374/m.2847 type:complete len:312 (+) Transcript_2374:17-952(+)